MLIVQKLRLIKVAPADMRIYRQQSGSDRVEKSSSVLSDLNDHILSSSLLSL